MPDIRSGCIVSALMWALHLGSSTKCSEHNKTRQVAFLNWRLQAVKMFMDAGNERNMINNHFTHPAQTMAHKLNVVCGLNKTGGLDAVTATHECNRWQYRHNKKSACLPGLRFALSFWSHIFWMGKRAPNRHETSVQIWTEGWSYTKTHILFMVRVSLSGRVVGYVHMNCLYRLFSLGTRCGPGAKQKFGHA